jgi:uncharacterized protein
MIVTRNDTAHRFEVELDGEIAHADFRVEPDGVLFPHTVVPDAFEGRGVGSALVKTALAWAREQGLKVKPACSFFAGWIARHPEAHDLVHPDWRGRIGL